MCRGGISTLFSPFLICLARKNRCHASNSFPHCPAPTHAAHRSCYLNAPLQLLSHSGPFVSQILLGRTGGDDVHSSGSVVAHETSLLIREHWAHPLEKPAAAVNPGRLLGALRDAAPHVFSSPGMQADAFEAALSLLDNIGGTAAANLFSHEKRRFLTCAEPLVARELRSSSEPALSLPIPDADDAPSAGVDLRDLLAASWAAEPLDGYRHEGELASGCQVRTTFASLPGLLLLRLERFKMDYDAGAAFKVSTPVRAPQFLRLGSEAEVGGGDTGLANASAAAAVLGGYQLTGIVHHSGSLDSGHYWATFLHPLYKTWFYASDSFVEALRGEVSPGAASSTPYVYLYERIAESVNGG